MKTKTVENLSTVLFYITSYDFHHFSSTNSKHCSKLSENVENTNGNGTMLLYDVRRLCQQLKI